LPTLHSTAVIATEAIHSSFLCAAMDCFAALAMTVWLFEN
jgi:hypothetical protein